MYIACPLTLHVHVFGRFPHDIYLAYSVFVWKYIRDGIPYVHRKLVICNVWIKYYALISNKHVGITTDGTASLVHLLALASAARASTALAGHAGDTGEDAVARALAGLVVMEGLREVLSG